MPLNHPSEVPGVLEALVRRHRELSAEATALARDLERAGAPDRLQAVFRAFADAIRFHVEREEGFLFPAMRALADGDHAAVALLGTMSTLELEHGDLRRLQEALVALAEDAGLLGTRIVAFLAAWEAHHEAEDAVLFPRIRDLIGVPITWAGR